MDYFPLSFDLKQRPCLVVGGGEIARRKIDLILRAGAKITVVSPVLIEELESLRAQGIIDHLARKFEEQDLDGKYLVISATENTLVNERVSQLANQRQLPVNVVDSPDLSTVIFPAIIDRSPLLISVSSGGKAPVMVRKVRELLEATVPQHFARLAGYLGEVRSRMKQTYSDIDERRKVTENFVESGIASLASAADRDAAETFLFGDPNARSQEVSQGEVYLVGAGPGDPDLLTLRALQLMQKADIVLYDNLVSEQILDRVRRDASREYVGKLGRGAFTAQETINDKLVRLAKEGNRVLRLKGGDPFIFGRGGEEIESLIECEIPFQVVPGITAASGCAAYTGIPLTHRELSQSVRFVTGHPKDGHVDLQWREFAHKNQTIVFYMGLGGLKSICDQLISHGRASTTPVAVISKGTLPDQIVIVGDLENIYQRTTAHEISRPTLIIVGEVVALMPGFDASISRP